MNSESELTCKPKISIIVPFYNVEQYARQCIESILAQTYDNIEIILVDDDSPDNCGIICDEYAALDTRIKVIHKPNGGVSEARNAGLKLASGEYVGFVDSDDWIESDMYETMVNAIIKNKADIAVCNIIYEYRNHTSPDEDGFKEDLIVSRDEALKMLVEDEALKSFAHNKLYKRTIITEFFPVSRIFEDIYISVRWFSNASKVCLMAYDGYHYRQRSGSIMHVDNSKKFIQYLESRIAQLEYLKSRSLIVNDLPKYEHKLVRSCIREAKIMARRMPANNDYFEGIDKMVELLRPYIDNAWPSLKRKYRSYYSQFVKHPSLFHFRMRIGKLFHKTKKVIKPTYDCFQ